ncbi:MAG: family 10 glycosylhydrolase [Lachnospiraceae bacterium]|nr:family 10 glycosylhydrolase [Lachnospiraceae bacterium]
MKQKYIINNTIYNRIKNYIMFKKIFWCAVLLLFPVITALYSCKAASAAEHRGIWISYIDYEDAGLYDQSESSFKANSDAMFKKLKSYGFNTVYFQVRPYDDAVYPSDIFKWCTYLAPSEPSYDPLEILVEKAHKYGLSFHAWVNPYRITQENIHNPAKNASTERIVDGVKEIIENYDVDGIHFDDYFYPSRHKGMQYYSVPIAERKENVNNMIRTVYAAIKQQNPDITFGISPAGNTEYAESIGCDLETWVNEDGYVDYIIPQLYWSDNYKTSDGNTKFYTDTLEEWTSIISGSKPTYIGLALYKAGLKSSVDKGWRKSKSNIINQIKLERDYGCDGYVMFSYRSLFTQDGKKEFANYIKSISGLKLTKSGITLKKGKSYNIKNKVKVKSKYKTTFKYKSEKPRIASVSPNGKIKAKKRGTARIHIKGLAGSRVTCKVRVR